MDYQEPMLNKIEDYLLGSLNEADRQNFETTLSQDAELAAEVERQRKLIHGVSLAARAELKRDLKKIHQKVVTIPQTTPTPAIFSLRKWGAIAASLLLLIAAGWWLWPNTLTNQQIFAANYQPYNLSIVFRNDTADERLSQADQSYKAGEYAQALPVFQSLLEEQAEDPQLRLGYAICLYETGEDQLAIPELQKIYDANTPFLKNQATWYLGLLHLKNDQVALAKPYFQSLADQAKADHHKAAKAIVESLN